jgi:diacylglycerol kinase family enzyme
MRSRIAYLFQSANLAAEIVVIEPGEAVDTAARRAVASGATIVVAAGGDGTVSGTAAALAGSPTPLGVLPLGTLNHFAKDLGIPTDLEPAVSAIAASQHVVVDVGEVNGRVFVNNSSIGIYPNIVVHRDALRQRGFGKWTALVLAAVGMVRRYRGVRVTIASGDATRMTRTPFVFVGNNEYRANGLAIGGRARLDQGRLSAYLAPRVHTRDLPRLFARAVTGRALSRDALDAFSTTGLEIEIARRHVRVAIDGEVAVMTTPLRFRVRPLALRVIVPKR